MRRLQVVKKFKFGGTVLDELPILILSNFVKFYLFFIFANRENSMCLPSVVKEFEFWRPV